MSALPSARPLRPLRREVLRHQLELIPLPTRCQALLAGLAPGPTCADTASATAMNHVAPLLGLMVRGEAGSETYDSAVAALSGLGPGLTPTGDDLLVALLAFAPRLVDAGLLERESIARLRAAVQARPAGRTTDVAERLLDEACVGRIPEPLERFIEALGNTDIDASELGERAARLLAIGAHSGADWLAGVFALARASLDESRTGDGNDSGLSTGAVTYAESDPEYRYPPCGFGS